MCLSDRKETKSKRYIVFKAYIAASIFFVMFWGICLKSNIYEIVKGKLSSSNIVIFICSILLFVLVYLICVCLLTKGIIISSESGSLNKKQYKFANVSFIFVEMFILSMIYFGETTILGSNAENFIWHTQPVTTLIMVICVLTVFWIMFEKIHIESIKQKLGIETIFFVLMSVLIFSAHYFPAYIVDEGTLHHGHAYFNSVYNVLHKVPFETATNSIYGNYGLFFAPIMKVLGSSVKVFTVLVACVAVLSYLSAIYVLCSVTKKTWIRVAGALAMGISVVSMRPDVYYQLQPHRVFFPCLVIAFLSLKTKYEHKKWIWGIVENIIAVLSIVWNKEIGIICVAVMMIGEVYNTIQKNGINTWCFWKRTSGAIIKVLADIGVAILIVAGYNYIVAQKGISLSDFFFPLFSESYMDETLRADIPFQITAGVMIVLLVLFHLSKAIYNTKLCQKFPEMRREETITFYVAVMALGMIVYYVNRPAYYNLDIVFYNAVILLALDIDNWHKIHNSKKINETFIQAFFNATGMVLSSVLVVLAFFTIINYPYAAEVRSKFQDTEQLEKVVADFNTKISPDTKGVGYGVVEIYSTLGWDTRWYTQDVADIDILPEQFYTLVSDIKEMEEPIVVCSLTLDKIERLIPGFTEEFLLTTNIEEITRCTDMAYYYCTPKNTK